MIGNEKSEMTAFCEAVKNCVPPDKLENRGRTFICKCPACNGVVSVMRKPDSGRVHAECGRCKRTIDL